MFKDRITEVISFKAIFEVEEFYIKLNVWDDLSPNRWYNMIGEGHLDDTEYSINVELEFSQDKKYLNIWKENFKNKYIFI